jgi:hypothetical protein
MNENGGKSISGSENPVSSFHHEVFDNGNDESNKNSTAKKRLFLPVNNTSSGTNKVIKGANEAGFYLVDSLISIYTATKNLSNLTAAKNANAVINALNNQEQNQKDFNSIYCVYLEDDSLVTNSQIQILQNMAQLCPFTEGLAVYESRALMRNWDDSTMYYNVCENNAPELNTNQRLTNGAINPIEKEVITSVFPNPTDGNLLVSCNCKNCIFEVYDVAGKMVLSKKINEIATKVDVTTLNNGVYMYRLTEAGKTIKSDKLILNK